MSKASKAQSSAKKRNTNGGVGKGHKKKGGKQTFLEKQAKPIKQSKQVKKK